MAESLTELVSNPSSNPSTKPVHSLVLDTGPLIQNDPPVSVLIAKAEALFTTPSVLAEIRDPVTRSRVETTLRPLLTVRTPKPESLRFVQGFARKTGDLAVLSRPDLEVLALTYELECERNRGDWRLRNTPGQQRLNGRPDEKPASTGDEKDTDPPQAHGCDEATKPLGDAEDPDARRQPLETSMASLDLGDAAAPGPEVEGTAPSVPSCCMSRKEGAEKSKDEGRDQDGSDAEDSEGGEWITPSNIKKHQALDSNMSSSSSSAGPHKAEKTLQAAMLTSDYAMQNVALRMNLNLLTPSLARITRLKNWVLRCHGCFAVTKDMEKRFCPSCGQPTLLRASCSTDRNGVFRVHLKSNFQWNKRGNVYSVPKPVHGNASGKHTRSSSAGGRDGWGRDLMLAEDQKEFVRAVEERRRARRKEIDLMDEDRLPGLLSRERAGGEGGRIRVGAGRNVNARRRKK
ncbi:hypothetical protein L249_7766 [Ophiocordyceps polyrhachis-furcata BCC 54312]|uniref:20S-pre-rRNA D-site endonuclease NOB1 n=1 Tax=Ophiocordyceps polyrhachis-furcata BCC 54312 TaxID=1330021 RepID=A0A367LAR8_9HYPO|nr:hypothetical protein L249_7766 [Ophiocordyceps polyrhachis-furcata BCC 54312]